MINLAREMRDYEMQFYRSEMTCIFDARTSTSTSVKYVLYILIKTHTLLDCAIVNIGLGNDLAPSDPKPLVELMFTQIYVTMWGY